MPQYLIYFNQQWVGDHPPEWYGTRVEPSMAVVNEMREAGVWLFGGGLEEPDSGARISRLTKSNIYCATAAPGSSARMRRAARR